MSEDNSEQKGLNAGIDRGASLWKAREFRRFLVGALLAASFFLIQAGVAEILLAKEARCQAVMDRMRLSPDPSEVCLPEWQSFMLVAASRGVLGLLKPDIGPAPAWALMLVLYALTGGSCAQLSTRWSVMLFLALNLSLVAALAGMIYISQFIIWPWAS